MEVEVIVDRKSKIMWVGLLSQKVTKVVILPSDWKEDLAIDSSELSKLVCRAPGELNAYYVINMGKYVSW